jgi:hypothetical protein
LSDKPKFAGEEEVAALAIALCDVLTVEAVRLRAALMVLEKKGLLSSDEWRQAIDDFPAESVQAISDQVQKEVRQRLREHLHMMADDPKNVQ